MPENVPPNAQTVPVIGVNVPSTHSTDPQNSTSEIEDTTTIHKSDEKSPINRPKLISSNPPSLLLSIIYSLCFVPLFLTNIAVWSATIKYSNYLEMAIIIAWTYCTFHFIVLFISHVTGWILALRSRQNRYLEDNLGIECLILLPGALISKIGASFIEDSGKHSYNINHHIPSSSDSSTFTSWIIAIVCAILLALFIYRLDKESYTKQKRI